MALCGVSGRGGTFSDLWAVSFSGLKGRFYFLVLWMGRWCCGPPQTSPMTSF